MAPHHPIYTMGSVGFKASCQGLGCMGMSAFYKDADHTATEEESIAVIHRAIDLGITLLDTSDVYGPFTNEELLGKALKGVRSKVQLCTKFGIKFSQEAGLTYNGSPKYVREACMSSLKRLDTDYIDLYYMHRMDPSTPIENTMGELKALVEEGKIRYVGLSEVSASDLRRAHKVHPITAVQLEWSLWTRDVEVHVCKVMQVSSSASQESAAELLKHLLAPDCTVVACLITHAHSGQFGYWLQTDLVPTCRELGVGIVAYSPIGRGMLTGKYSRIEDLDVSDARRSIPRFAEAAFQQNLKLVENVKKLAARKNVTAGQMALAWLQHQGKDVFPIPGTNRVKHLEENVAAVHIKLTRQELQELEEAVPESQVKGMRYHEGMMGGTYASYHTAQPAQSTG